MRCSQRTTHLSTSSSAAGNLLGYAVQGEEVTSPGPTITVLKGDSVTSVRGALQSASRAEAELIGGWRRRLLEAGSRHVGGAVVPPRPHRDQLAAGRLPETLRRPRQERLLVEHQRRRCARLPAALRGLAPRRRRKPGGVAARH